MSDFFTSTETGLGDLTEAIYHANLGSFSVTASEVYLSNLVPQLPADTHCIKASPPTTAIS